MFQKNMDTNSFRSILKVLPFKIATLLGIYFICKYFDLPLGLTGSFLLFIASVLIVVLNYRNFRKPQKIAFIGLIFSSAILSTLFAYDHFIVDIRITIIHIALIVFPPILIGNYLTNKEKT